MRSIVLAGLFVAAGYFTLTFYDLFALARDRPQRRPLPGRRTRRLHQLLDRTQCRCERLYRRRSPLSRLFGLGSFAPSMSRKSALSPA